MGFKFPVKALSLVLHIDRPKAGSHKNFEGTNSYFIAADDMTSVACMKIVAEASATTYASVLMTIMIHHVICHTLVIDKDNKFFNVFFEVVDLLQLNCYVLSI